MMKFQLLEGLKKTGFLTLNMLILKNGKGKCVQGLVYIWTYKLPMVGFIKNGHNAEAWVVFGSFGH